MKTIRIKQEVDNIEREFWLKTTIKYQKEIIYASGTVDIPDILIEVELIKDHLQSEEFIGKPEDSFKDIMGKKTKIFLLVVYFFGGENLRRDHQIDLETQAENLKDREEDLNNQDKDLKKQEKRIDKNIKIKMRTYQEQNLKDNPKPQTPNPKPQPPNPFLINFPLF